MPLFVSAPCHVRRQCDDEGVEVVGIPLKVFASPARTQRPRCQTLLEDKVNLIQVFAGSFGIREIMKGHIFNLLFEQSACSIAANREVGHGVGCGVVWGVLVCGTVWDGVW